MTLVSPIRRFLAAAATVAAACSSAAPAWAATADYPSRPIRFIVGFAPGGIADLLARSMGQKLTEAWGQQVIIDNRTGGGGIISMQIAATAPRDGYTLLMGSSTQFSINPGLRASVPYDPIRDYTPVTQSGLTPVILTVHPAFPAKSLPELIQLAKGKPGTPLSYGSTGFGAAPHISAELLKKVTGISMTHVPYKGGSEAVSALLGGHVQMSFGAVSTSLGQVKAGRLRALGVTSAKRLSAVPDVPTFAESGLRGFRGRAVVRGVHACRGVAGDRAQAPRRARARAELARSSGSSSRRRASRSEARRPKRSRLTSKRSSRGGRES